MSHSLHEAAYAKARAAIKAGKVEEGEWSAPGDAEREQDDCLGSDKSYPVMKGGKVYRRGVAAAHSRAAQQGDEEISDAADRLMKLLDKGKSPAAASQQHGWLLPVAAGRSTLVPIALSGFPAQIEGQPVEYRRKEVSTHGRVLQDVKGNPFPVTRDRLDKWIGNFNRMAASGMRVPIYNKHYDVTADDSRGYVVKMERQGDSLYAIEQLIGPDAILAASRNDQSVFIDVNVQDDRGNIYDEAVTHIAFTATPQVTGMSGYAKVAASRGAVVDALVLHQATPQQRSFTMNGELAKKLRAKLGVPEDVGDEQLAEKVGEKFLADADQLATITKERDTAVAASRQHAPVTDAGELDRMSSLAEREIDVAAASGDLPTSVAERLKTSLKADGKPAPAAFSRTPATANVEPHRFVIDLFKGLKLGTQASGQPKTGAPVAASRDYQQTGGKDDEDKVAEEARKEGQRIRDEQLAARGIK